MLCCCSDVFSYKADDEIDDSGEHKRSFDDSDETTVANIVFRWLRGARDSNSDTNDGGSDKKEMAAAAYLDKLRNALSTRYVHNGHFHRGYVHAYGRGIVYICV